jgi:hypothetical protein
LLLNFFLLFIGEHLGGFSSYKLGDQSLGERVLQHEDMSVSMNRVLLDLLAYRVHVGVFLQSSKC